MTDRLGLYQIGNKVRREAKEDMQETFPPTWYRAALLYAHLHGSPGERWDGWGRVGVEIPKEGKKGVGGSWCELGEPV